ncbi:MAG TPA: type II secretion system F family protein [Anaeromyxobacter sp.]|nr:type II secretion system F family protein [Anaeromyxobacter sp.]
MDGIVLTLGALATLAVFGLLGAARSLGGTSESLLRRLQPTGIGRAEAEAVEKLRPSLGAGLARHLEPLARVAGASEDQLSGIRKTLSWAGFRGPHAVQSYLGSKVLAAGAGLVLFTIVNVLSDEAVKSPLLVAVLLTGGGYLLPNLWLSSRVATRQKLLERALPDALDLLVTCVEAGLGLDSALQRVAAETALAFPLLSDELRQTFLEINAGIKRTDAFRRLGDRTGVSELRALAATLNQTEMFGTSVGTALRVQAEGMRIRRMQKAEEKAAYLAVKMTLPLVACILPSLIAIVVGPAAVNIINHLLPILGGK